MEKLLIATSNPGKLKEYKELLKGLPLEFVSLKDLEIDAKATEDGKNFKENAIKKAKFYSKLTGLPTLSDDGGLEIDYLNGDPGVNSHRWPGHEATDEELVKFTLKKMKGVPWKKRGAQLKVVIALKIPGKKVFTSEGKIRGFILTKPREKIIPGYPFRSIFYLPQYRKSFNQLSEEEELKISHRKKAIKEIIKFLKSEKII